jgi:hypothetical protein
MPDPGFWADLLTPHGTPRWLADLTDDDEVCSVLAVRDLEPARALELLGVRPAHITSDAILPPLSPEGVSFSLVRAAIEPTDASAVFLAAKHGPWTFVFHDTNEIHMSGATEVLAAEGGEAISVGNTIKSQNYFVYSVGGELVVEEDYSIAEMLTDEQIPEALRPAVDAARAFDRSHLEPDSPDAFNERVLCAHADLRFSLDDLRAKPYLIGTLG